MKTAIAANLKEYRTKAGLTQQQVAEALKIERSTYTYYENGKSTPSLDNIGKIAKLFGVEYTVLLDGIGEDVNEQFEKAGNADQNDVYKTHATTKFEMQLLYTSRQLTPKQRKEMLAIMKDYMEKNNK